MWLDSHCHLTADRFDEDRSQTLERARQAGISEMIAIGSGYGTDTIQATVDLARDEADVFATVGIHPHDAAEADEGLFEKLRVWSEEDSVVAIGECGLDYHYMNSDRDAQRDVFARQVALARELDMPVSIHVRGDEPDAYGEMLDIWRAEGRDEVQGVLHCYTGTLDFAREAVKSQFMVSFSGIITFKKSAALREVASALPLELLMVETDAPFLAPEGHRGKRNEPAWVIGVGECLAQLHGRSVDEIGAITRENAKRFYRLNP
ncbi:MAG: TatD family hydrolase [Myxococcota bacterium]|nr:TatD family hydrolase [Myxococcota bacterium]